MNRLQNSASGFTLIELMVTLSVVAILATMAMPSYSTFIEKREITGAAEEIAAFVMSARGEAVKHNEQTTLSFNLAVNGDWCIGMILGGVACDCTNATVADASFCALKYTDSNDANVIENQLMSSDDYSGFVLSAASTGSGDSALTYDPVLGILADVTDVLSMSIQSNNAAYELTVGVSATGTVKICTNSSKAVTGFKSCSS